MFRLASSVALLAVPALAFPAEGEVALAAVDFDASLYSDAEIAGIVHTVSRVEIEHARLALQKTNNPAVELYANKVILDHEAADAKLGLTTTYLNMEMAESDLSQHITEVGTALAEELMRLEGDEFDRAFLRTQIQIHAAVEDVYRQFRLEVDDPLLEVDVWASRQMVRAHQFEGRIHFQTTGFGDDPGVEPPGGGGGQDPGQPGGGGGQGPGGQPGGGGGQDPGAGGDPGGPNPM